jgi:DNA topoisomerase I
MEGDLDKIENGSSWVPFMRAFNDELDQSLAKAREADPVRPTAMAEKTGEICPKCNEGELVKRAGKFGEFVGCSRYPACDYIKDREERPAAVETGKACPTCGRPLVVRQSRRGPFVGCSGYPDCRYTEQGEVAPQNQPQPQLLDEPCPVCGKPMVMRRGRFGEFKSCSDYPRCKGPVKASSGRRSRAASK